MLGIRNVDIAFSTPGRHRACHSSRICTCLYWHGAGSRLPSGKVVAADGRGRKEFEESLKMVTPGMEDMCCVRGPTIFAFLRSDYG